MTCGVIHPDDDTLACEMASGGHKGQHVAHRDGDEPLEERTVAWWPEPAQTLLDPAGWFDDEEYARHRQLGLRRVAWSHSEPHPDTRPCPTWCRCADDPGAHSIKTERTPMVAYHVSESIETLASFYPGKDVQADGETLFLGAVIETLLTRRGQSQTYMNLALVLRDGDTRRMTLSLEDAADLVTAMTYLLAKAEAAELVEEV